MDLKLPKWATLTKDGAILVKADEVYPLFLKALGWENAPLTQGMLETCRMIFTRHLREALVPEGQLLHLRIDIGSGVYKLKDYPATHPDAPGKGVRQPHVRIYEQLFRAKKIPG
jgi:hypothetical protein